MVRQVSIVVVYPADADFGSLLGELEREFLKKLESSAHRRVGAARACIIDVLVHDGFALQAVQRRLEALPTAGIAIVDRFPEPWWARPRWSAAIGAAVGIGVGIAMVFISDLLRPLVERMRGALG